MTVVMTVVMAVVLLGACSPVADTSPASAPIPRVGLLHVGTDHVPPSLNTLVARLIELGWIDRPQDEVMASLTEDGRIQSPRLELLWRNLEKEAVGAQAREFVDQHVDLIVAFEDKSIAAAQAATAEP